PGAARPPWRRRRPAPSHGPHCAARRSPAEEAGCKRSTSTAPAFAPWLVLLPTSRLSIRPTRLLFLLESEPQVGSLTNSGGRSAGGSRGGRQMEGRRGHRARVRLHPL